ncbi:MAG TPA: adenylate/guanylate cyclase domain-containing protein [Dongiaceae bacterium]|nr:adenylate/guanylate cyclase domain-containing protein [Dongiaceae bacterium]
MNQHQITRKLTAILAADVAGYSRLMGADEEGTLRRLADIRRELFDPKVVTHHGRIFKTTGDGLLVEFSSVVDAVRCAVEIQRAMAALNAAEPDDRRMDFRIGINLGDVMAVEDDIYGDGVNVASRIEGLAPPGGICLSKIVADQVHGKVALALEDMGDKHVKNIARPIRVLRVRLEEEGGLAPQSASGLRHHAHHGLARLALRRAWLIPLLALVLAIGGGYEIWHFVGRGPSVALARAGSSVAVLTFTALAGDAQQVSLAEGVTEDIVSQLAQVAGLNVIARNATAHTSSATTDIGTFGREMGVRYVVRGSVRTAGDQIRVSVQLVEVASGEEIWAGRYDLSGNGLKSEDAITEDITTQLIVQMRYRDLQLAKRTPVDQLDPYGFYLLGKEALFRDDFEGIEIARHMFDAAIARNPAYAPAWGGRALIALREFKMGRSGMSRNMALDHMFSLAQSALKLAPDVSDAQQVVANVYLYRGQYDQAIELLTSAIDATADDAGLHQALGDVYIYTGKSTEGIAQLDNLVHLDPFIDQGIYAIYGRGYILANALGKAVQNVELCMARAPQFRPCFFSATVAFAEAGRAEAAKDALARAQELSSDLTLADIAGLLPFKRPEDLERFEKGFAAAGLK